MYISSFSWVDQRRVLTIQIMVDDGQPGFREKSEQVKHKKSEKNKYNSKNTPLKCRQNMVSSIHLMSHVFETT